MDPVQAANDAMRSGQELLLVLFIGVPALALALVFLDRGLRRRARDRERHLRALEQIARSQHVANAREDQPGRDS